MLVNNVLPVRNALQTKICSPLLTCQINIGIFMPFIPHTEADVNSMLNAMDLKSVASLFDEIPSHLLANDLGKIGPGMSEMEIMRLMQERAEMDQGALCFLGAGAYEHHIPAAVWDIASRGEFMTAYTPYQAEASQGTLQLIYEYQSMMTALTAMDVSNASLYDGGSALAEAVLMAVRANRKSKSRQVLVAGTTHPRYLKATRTIVSAQGIELVQLPVDTDNLITQDGALTQYEDQDFAALIIPFPNYFGQLEDVHAMTDWAHSQNMLVIGVVNPIAISGMVPPGEWGDKGADIAVGDGQPLGLPLASGGPYFGFMCCRQAYVRQMPGRIIGRTVDLEGNTGYALTLQAREQHIRRSKATSNICTNQGLAVTAATIHMSLLGGDGLQVVAESCHQQSANLKQKLSALPGVEIIGSEDYFHEFVVQLPKDANTVLSKMVELGVLAGIALNEDFSGMGNRILVCVTETKTEADLDHYVTALTQALA